jgi:hypothetical protein
MDAFAIIFMALLFGTIVLAPFFAAETRPDFLRPHRPKTNRGIAGPPDR